MRLVDDTTVVAEIKIINLINTNWRSDPFAVVFVDGEERYTTGKVLNLPNPCWREDIHLQVLHITSRSDTQVTSGPVGRRLFSRSNFFANVLYLRRHDSLGK